MPQPRAVHRDGELVELASRTAAIGPSIQERMVFYAELKRIQETREYKSGWTAHKYREKFGDFPPFDFNTLPSCAPSASTLRWVQSRNIAWVKAQRRGAA